MFDLTSYRGVFCKFCDEEIEFIYNSAPNVKDQWMHIDVDSRYLFCKGDVLNVGLTHEFKATPDIEFPQKAI